MIALATIRVLCVERKTLSLKGQYDRTRTIINCVEYAVWKFREREGAYPATVEDCLEVATSDRYCTEWASAGSPVRDEIRSRLDGWERPFEFEYRRVGRLIKVNMISHGPNGRREYVEGNVPALGAEYDDVVGYFYLEPVVYSDVKSTDKGQHKGGQQKGHRREWH